ncbi:helix-turn-helix domain-containing protein [Nocardioides sp.]|uniref:TetR/AcrR family transcriptional regulator n=1 Tax=Nocardioides sp. TaxID=35761 RepID=UPI0025F41A90|nr:helix-turn-helix domain-containing protein [Nocardioides sp.]
MAEPGRDDVLTPGERDLPTDRRLLLAAERLFAAHGVGAVSLRTVISAAGANVASVHYHFGSKEELLAALLRDRTDALHRRRMALMDAVLAGGDPTCRDIADGLARPLLELVEQGAADWVRVVGQILTTRSLGPQLGAVFEGQWRDWDRIYGLARPELTASTRAFRLAQALDTSIGVLGAAEGYADWLGQSGPGGVAVVYGELVDAVVGMLEAESTRRSDTAHSNT